MDYARAVDAAAPLAEVGSKTAIGVAPERSLVVVVRWVKYTSADVAELVVAVFEAIDESMKHVGPDEPHVHLRNTIPRGVANGGLLELADHMCFPGMKYVFPSNGVKRCDKIALRQDVKKTDRNSEHECGKARVLSSGHRN